jgi:hypothetical protein
LAATAVVPLTTVSNTARISADVSISKLVLVEVPAVTLIATVEGETPCQSTRVPPLTEAV